MARPSAPPLRICVPSGDIATERTAAVCPTKSSRMKGLAAAASRGSSKATVPSSAPNTRRPEELVPDPDSARKKLRLLWLSCGNQDGLLRISQGVHAYLKEHDVPHVWNVDSNAHDPTHWRNNLYHFLQRIFR